MDQNSNRCGKDETMNASPAIKITSVQEERGTVTVKGTATGLGRGRVEVIVNGDLDLRYIVRVDEDGAWCCRFSIPHGGQYEIEASVRDYADFSRIRQATPDDNYFVMEDANVWGATVTKHTDGLYYMIFSTWDTHDGFKTDWYQYSELGYAASTRLNGPYVYMGKALDATYANTTNKKPVVWQPGEVNVFHNPTLLHSERDGKYYLYFMGTTTKGDKPASHLQRIGVAVADHPAGPFTVSEQPVIDVREHWEWSITANPSVIEIKQADGSYLYYAVYKGSGTYEGQRLKATGYAPAPTPLGPFKQSDAPIMRDPLVGFSVEDCYVWYQNGRYRALAKDMTKGNFSGVTGVYSYALFESEDGEHWALSEHKLAFKNEVPWVSGTMVYSHLERSQLYVEDGVPRLICNAATVNGESPYRDNSTCNVQIPLLGVPLAVDTCTLNVTDLPEKQVNKSVLQQLTQKAEAILAGDCAREKRKLLCSAVRAANILCKKESTARADVDFVAGRLRELLGEA